MTLGAADSDQVNIWDRELVVKDVMMYPLSREIP